MTASATYTSFLIRLWRELETEASGPSDGWRGEIEHVQDGQRWPFDSLEALFTFLREQVEDAGQPFERSRRPAMVGYSPDGGIS